MESVAIANDATMPPAPAAAVMAALGAAKADAAGVAQAWVFTDHTQPLQAHSVPLPAASELEPGSVLVRLTCASVCGSDLHTLDGRRTDPAAPLVLGHEGVGVVQALGPSPPNGLHLGDRVTWSVCKSCGDCRRCCSYRLPEKCATVFKFGHASFRAEGAPAVQGLSGCYASHILLPRGSHIVRVSATAERLPDAALAPANCALATAVNAVCAVPADSAAVVVQGAGLLGLFACALLRERGVGTVVCAGRGERLELAREFGATHVVDTSGEEGVQRLAADMAAATEGQGADAVIEACGSADVVPWGVRLCRPGATYVFVGMVHAATSLQGVTGDAIIRKCLTMRGLHNYQPQHLDAAVQFLTRAAHRLPLERVFSAPYPLSRLPEALEEARQRRWLRVMVAPDREGDDAWRSMAGPLP